jgi:glucose-6-phosphate 1-dehydrogenase
VQGGGPLEWSGKGFSKIVVTEHETRGLEGRGGFFDKVGQVRDMVQSHLLQAAPYST